MSDEVKESAYLAFEVLLGATILTFVVVLLFFGRAVHNNKVQGLSSTDNSKELVELYSYNNKTVKGSDIVEVINKYARVHRFEINISESDKFVIDYSTEHDSIKNGGGEGQEIWSSEYVTKLLGRSIYDSYYSTILYENEQVMGMKFDRIIGG